MYHAPLAASQTGRWLYCPGSIPFLQQLREIIPETPSPHAEEGTYAHKVLDHQLQVAYKGVKPDAKMFTFKDQWAIDIAIEYVQDRMAFNPGAQIFLENYVKPLPKVDDCGGTSDIIILTRKELEIIDYKHGRGVFVSPDWNTQLLTYALGAIELTDVDVKRVKMTIVQPRHGEAVKLSPQGNGVMSVTYDIEDVTVKFKKQLKEGITRVQEVTDKCDNPTFTMSKAYEQGFLSPGPGRKGCRFCDLKTFCPATTEGVTDAKATMREFADLDVSDDSLLTDEVIKQIYDMYLMAPELKQMASAAEDMMLQLLELDEPPEYIVKRVGLKPRLGNRTWIKPQADIVAKMVALGVAKKDLFDIKLKTVPNMLALLPKATQAQLQELYGRPNNGNKIVAK